jgi:putative transposase
MPVDKQQHTTLTPIPTTAESSSAQEVVQQSFHQQLRDHIRAAVQVVMEEIMREELTQFVGAHWGESTSARKGYRNGSYRRDLATSSGQIQDLKVPRDREGKFHTQLFDRYSRYEEQVAEGVTPMFVSGTGTHKVGEVAQTLLGVAPNASAVSRLNHTLTEQFEAWRRRPLPGRLSRALPRWHLL